MNEGYDLLVARGAAEVPHPGGVLADHLRRVARRVARHGAGEDICAAAACHAAYGTAGFDVPLLGRHERPLLRRAIGPRAEALVYEYGCCDRAAVHPQLGADRITFVDRFTGTRAERAATDLWGFIAITVANELDVLEHADLPPAARRDLVALFLRLARHVSVEAWIDLRPVVAAAATEAEGDQYRGERVMENGEPEPGSTRRRT